MFGMTRIDQPYILIPHKFPRIVCLCGSTKFKDDFIRANFDETLAGNIVLSVGFFGGSDNIDKEFFEQIKPGLDELHKRKIDLADEVLVINRDGYIGESTTSEIEYAINNRKRIRWLYPDQIPLEYKRSILK